MRVNFRKILYHFSILFFLMLWNCTTTDADNNTGDSFGAQGDGLEDSSEIFQEAHEEVTLPLEKVHFDFDQYFIKDEFKRDLNEIARYLLDNPSFTLRMEGHCDERGTTEYNLALGQRRADAVKRFLVTLGVDENRLTTHSYGKERPVDTSGTKEGHYMNRRTEFVSKFIAHKSF